MKLNDLRTLIREEIQNELQQGNESSPNEKEKIEKALLNLGIMESDELTEYDVNPSNMDVLIALGIVAGIFGTAAAATYKDKIVAWAKSKLKK